MTALEAQFRGDSQVCPLGVTALDDHDVVFFFSGTHSCSRLFGLDVASVGDRLDMAMGCGAWLVVARSLWSTRSGCFSLRGLELGNSSLRVFPCADTSNRRNFDRQGSSLSLSLCSSETIISLPDRLVPRDFGLFGESFPFGRVTGPCGEALFQATLLGVCSFRVLTGVYRDGSRSHVIPRFFLGFADLGILPLIGSRMSFRLCAAAGFPFLGVGARGHLWSGI